MKTFKCSKFVRRDYECINIVYCIAEAAPDEDWIEIDGPIPSDVDPLFTKYAKPAGYAEPIRVQYFGFM
jgi:hypothetical protein